MRSRIGRRAFLAGGVAALVPLAGSSRAGAQPAEKVTLRLNAPAYGEHAPFAIGVEKKFFLEEGIDLALREGQGSGNTVQVVASRSDPIGYADTPTMMKGSAKGLPLRTVAVFQQVSPQAIIFLKEKGYRAPKDLEGQSIALTAGDSIHQLLPAFLRKNGADPAKVRLLFMETAAKSTAVIAGKTDAMGGFFTTQAGQIAAVAKKDTAWLRYADFGVNLELMRTPRATGKSPGWVAREDVQDTLDLLAEFGGLSPKGKPEDYVTNEYLPG